MKRISLTMVSIVLFVAAVAGARSFEIPETVLMSAKQFEDYTPKKADVTFNHVSHLDINCIDCHHTMPDTYTIESCMTEGCHDNIKSRGEVDSVYFAFHTGRDTSKSCVGCHRKLKKEGDSDAPLTCNGCHVQ